MVSEVDINVNFRGAGGLGGGRTSVPGAVGAVGSPGILGIAAGVAGGFGIATILKGIWDATLESSSSLKGTMKIINTIMKLILMPIGDLLSNLIRPLAIALIPVAVKMSEWMYGGGMDRIMLFLQGTGEILMGIYNILEAIGAAVPALFATIGTLVNPFMTWEEKQRIISGLWGPVEEKISEAGRNFASGAFRMIVAMGDWEDEAALHIGILRQMKTEEVANILEESANTGRAALDIMMETAARMGLIPDEITNAGNNVVDALNDAADSIRRMERGRRVETRQYASGTIRNTRTNESKTYYYDVKLPSERPGVGRVLEPTITRLPHPLDPAAYRERYIKHMGVSPP